MINNGEMDAIIGIRVSGGSGEARNRGTIVATEGELNPRGGGSLSEGIGISVFVSSDFFDSLPTPVPESDPLVARNVGRIEADIGISFDWDGYGDVDFESGFVPFEARNSGVIEADTGIFVSGALNPLSFSFPIVYDIRNSGDIVTREVGIRVGGGFVEATGANVVSTGTIMAAKGIMATLLTGSVVNRGEIFGSEIGMAAGYWFPFERPPAQIVNAGTITMTGDGSLPVVGMALGGLSDFPGDYFALSAQEGRVVNSGTITGGSSSSQDVGIRLGIRDAELGEGAGRNTVINSGQISGFEFGIADFGGFNTIRNTVTGVITALDTRIAVDGDGQRVVNQGAIVADVGLSVLGSENTVLNYGTVEARVGAELGLRYGSFVNQGEIFATEVGVTASFEGDLGPFSGVPQIVNRGTIRVTSDGTGPVTGILYGAVDLPGFDGAQASAGTARIFNEGLIEGVSAAPGSAGIAIGLPGQGVAFSERIIVSNRGDIRGFDYGIDFRSHAGVVENLGAITADLLAFVSMGLYRSWRTSAQ